MTHIPEVGTYHPKTALFIMLLLTLSGLIGINCIETKSHIRKAYVWVETATPSTGDIIINQSGQLRQIKAPLKSRQIFEYDTQLTLVSQITITMPHPFKWAYGCEGLPTEIGESSGNTLSLTITPCP